MYKFDQYKVPLIPLNLRPQETLVQIGDALQHLLAAVEDICSRVSARIAQNELKLESLSLDIEAAGASVKLARQQKQSLKVMSCSKFPAEGTYKAFRSVFEGRPATIKRSKLECGELCPRPTERLKVYHVRQKKKLNVARGSQLGAPPATIDSISDLLLFNTSESPYLQKELSDPLKVGLRGRSAERAVQGQQPDEAPWSIAHKKPPSQPTPHHLWFDPDLATTPALAVPEDLPDLPGIALDLKYGNYAQTTNEQLPNSPTTVGKVETTEGIPRVSPIEVAKETLVDVEPSLELSNEIQSRGSEPTKSELGEPSSKLATALEKKETELEPNCEPENISPKVQKTTEPRPKPNQGNAHASLMEAIRQAGGSSKANLKPSSSSTYSNQNANNKTKSGAGGDLMADLHAKLSLRRKGISGHAMDPVARLPAIIPTILPPPQQHTNDTSSDDGVWDED